MKLDGPPGEPDLRLHPVPEAGAGGAAGAEVGSFDEGPAGGMGGTGDGSGGSPGNGGNAGDGDAGPGTGGTGMGGSTPDVAPEAPAPETAPPVDPKPTDGLLAAFSFDNEPGAPNGAGEYTVSDGQGNSVLTHNLTFVTDAPTGAPAGAKSLQFNGTTGYADVTLKTRPLNNGPKTIGVWFKSTSGTGIRNLVVLGIKADEITDVGVQLGLSVDNIAAWRYGRNPEMTAPALRNVWQHATYTFSGAAAGSIHRVFLDGVLVATLGNRAMLDARALDRVMLGTYMAPDEMFKGQLRDLRIYNRVLSDAEVKAIARPD